MRSRKRRYKLEEKPQGRISFTGRYGTATQTAVEFIPAYGF
jgi:hypothetical protein